MANLEQELEYSYKLVSKRFRSGFDKPDLIVGDKYELGLVVVRGLNDLGKPPPEALFDDSIYKIIVPEEFLEIHSDKRIYTFCHELGHALINYTNPSLAEKEVEHIRNKERAYSFRIFHEGMADYIAVEACSSADLNTYDCATERYNDLVDSFKSLLGLRDWKLLEGFYKTYNSKDTIYKHYQKSPDIAFHYSYILGYSFVNSLKQDDIFALIRKPPVSFRQILYPEEYQI